MNKKDIAKLSVSTIAILILLAVAFRFFVPPAKDNGIMVEVPHPVNPSFDQSQLDTLKNKVTDFRPDINPTDSAPKKIIE